MKKGFTLVETLVSILLFATIAVIVGSVFVSALDLQRRANNLQQTEENASYVLEFMTKEIRVAQSIISTDGCMTAPLSELKIINQYGETVTYSWDGTNILRRVAFTLPINSATVKFTRLSFCIAGATVGDQKQPRVTISASIQSVNTKQQITVDTQTTISLRQLVN